ncbi:ATP-binding protein [Dictyobacter arantiisoli]|uniref:AAA+ ATPase domain-containing protein n=1 Tax=Dictyobacter arantiisoli TaxID=2014874 RepID=A0A5A5TI44_9CHLR|nr:ATP-binding protein [Dictyobacter arantiisoli]GCF10885.1 hypothetical protein KDI_44490 [Dictyobacter arantiisoli]
MDHIKDSMHRATNRSAFRVVRPLTHKPLQHWEEGQGDGDWEVGEDEADALVEETAVGSERDDDRADQPFVLAKPRGQVPPPMPVCPLCRGAGYLRQDVPYGHPDFGKPLECGCHEKMRKEEEQQRLKKQSQLDGLPRFADATFDGFDATVPGVKQAYQSAYKFAMRPKGWLVLVGPNGCGKTHLAVAVAKERQDLGDTMMIQTVPDLLDHLRSGFSSSTYERLFDQLRTVDFLVLDDLGAQADSLWAQEKLFQLLNYRYNSMLPTLITANHLRMDERVASRLSDRGLVTMVMMDQAKDYRPNNAPI